MVMKFYLPHKLRTLAGHINDFALEQLTLCVTHII